LVKKKKNTKFYFYFIKQNKNIDYLNALFYCEQEEIKIKLAIKVMRQWDNVKLYIFYQQLLFAKNFSF
jgi:hypothetical protein